MKEEKDYDPTTWKWNEPVMTDRGEIDRKGTISAASTKFKDDFNKIMQKMDIPISVLLTVAFIAFAISSYLSHSLIIAIAFSCFAIVNLIGLLAKIYNALTIKEEQKES